MRDARDPRRQQLRTELIARLERVRGRMTDAEFDALIASVERTAARFAEIDAGPFMTPASVDRVR
jgi:hypothetical protein